MGEILVKEKQIVVPGEILATGMDHLPAAGAFREEDNVVASQLGLVNISGRLIKITPLAGPYVPKKGDTVIGRVVDMSYSSWFIDIGYAYDGNLNMREASSSFIPRGAELSEIYAIGEFVLTSITNVTKSKAIDLSMRGPGLRKLVGGKFVSIPASKIPRVVGKQGSMINMLKEMTGCQISAGQNGRVWILGKDPASEKLASDAIELIAEKAHHSGLTESVKAFLENGKGEKK